MDLIVELKITNLSDWAIIQPLLKRLKINFVQNLRKDENKNYFIHFIGNRFFYGL